MPPAGRLGDKSFCPADSHGCKGCPHPVQGPAVTGSPDILINGKPALRIGDTGVHSGCCGPNTWNAKAGSASVFFNNMQAHRLGDADEHCGGMGNLIEGSPDVLIGGGGITINADGGITIGSSVVIGDDGVVSQSVGSNNEMSATAAQAAAGSMSNSAIAKPKAPKLAQEAKSPPAESQRSQYDARLQNQSSVTDQANSHESKSSTEPDGDTNLAQANNQVASVADDFVPANMVEQYLLKKREIHVRETKHFRDMVIQIAVEYGPQRILNIPSRPGTVIKMGSRAYIDLKKTLTEIENSGKYELKIGGFSVNTKEIGKRLEIAVTEIQRIDKEIKQIKERRITREEEDRLNFEIEKLTRLLEEMEEYHDHVFTMGMLLIKANHVKGKSAAMYSALEAHYNGAQGLLLKLVDSHQLGEITTDEYDKKLKAIKNNSTIYRQEWEKLSIDTVDYYKKQEITYINAKKIGMIFGGQKTAGEYNYLNTQLAPLRKAMVENDEPIDTIDKKLEKMETQFPNILKGYEHIYRNEGFNPSHVKKAPVNNAVGKNIG